MRPFRRAVGAALAGGVVLAVAVLPGGAGAAAPQTTVTFKATGTITMTARGNGHGHGMSQYGAYGAALAGLSTPQILAHYYPGTTLADVGTGNFRVLLSGAPSTLTVWPASSLRINGTGSTLPTSGVRYYRLVADAGSTLTLQRLTSTKGATWTTYRSGLPNGSQFTRPGGGLIRMVTGSGSTEYYGYLRAVRVNSRGTAGGVHTVNVVGYNLYTQGVVASEMPTSWSPAAVAAQAVAARSYAMYEKQHSAGNYYDLCDSSWCQVYSGHVQRNSAGTVVGTDYPPATQGNVNRVLEYRGSAIFAQFAASNGGYMSSGGQPYLRAGTDQYDPGRSGDPYINRTARETVKTFAHDFGMSTVTKIVLTRDGTGTWGGRVTGVTLYNGSSHKTVSPDTLGWEFNFGTTLYTLSAS